ncbi:hypothetical protein ABID16_003081 [Rhizobium aquaticum]|uniref:Transcriptional regulator n=1 Tax=Rhizobium aquaticum TaxID=1549636 RepID=A0ABV2J1V5_9HYPH
MADFIAVIRRAVDGLSDNTPEMRVRVYERARSAVQRQLDNMKPRPADDVITRQLEKLDEAIASIEREFTGAPAAEPSAPTPEIVKDVAPPPAPPAREPEPEPTPAAKPEPAPQVAAPEPAEQTPPPFLMREPAPVVAEPIAAKAEPAFAPEPKFEPAPQPKADVTVPTPPEATSSAAEDDTMPPAAAETETPWQRERFDEPLGAREPSRPAERAWEPPAAPAWPPLEREAPLDRKDNRFSFDAQTAEPQATTTATATDVWTPVVTDNPFHEPAEIFTPSAEPDVLAKHDALLGITKPKPPAEAKSWWDDNEAPKQPTPLPSAARDASWDSFEAFVGERSGANPAGEIPAAATPRGRDGMSISDTPATPERNAPVAEERGEGRGKLVAGILAAVLVLAGTGYAGWRFSDTILGFINGTSSTSSQTASKSQPASTTTQPPASATKPAAGTTTPAATTAPAVTGPQKFTQRLMADGSEVDSGTSGEQVASAAQAEGKSVANQNEKPTPTPAQTPSTPATTPGTTPATTPATSQPETASAQQATPVKMFLYEERLGQASPTALEGTVTWSVKNDDQDGHKGKMIQGDISVPGRKMSAIFALRKNNDPTLPASHIIELTFSLPKDFEGRGIESVLRISMKDKEQEQGDALVAVPAKITDYFHMVALNAFADAVKNNLNLLKSRDWIDIPVTYSNGRRALLTLQKGPEGQKVFDEVISSWQANGDGAAPAATPPAQ